MQIIITAMLIAGAFAIAGAVTAFPLSPWLSHIGATPGAEIGLLRPGAGK